ncbi:MAG: ferritin-like domain-containing protein [Desulfobacterales bacterium]
MNTKAVLKLLDKLIQLDIDTVYIYDRTLDAFEDRVIKERISRFRENHKQHVERLASEMQALGGTPPDFSRDLKGHVITAFTALGTLTGMKGALKALKITEDITNRVYGEAVSSDVPDELKDMLRKHFSDEKIHLDYIVNVI